MLCGYISLAQTPDPDTEELALIAPSGVSLVVLGTVQDGGSPHIGCRRDCCRDLFRHPDEDRKVVSLGLVDHESSQTFIFEATPDFPEQSDILRRRAGSAGGPVPDGILLTHAHIGHYTGLMYLGKEAMNANAVPVYAMPRMKTFLEENGPWSQLVAERNIVLKEIAHERETQLTPNVRVKPFTVPHRDEYSGTVGYLITGPEKQALFIPDIDKWEKWDTDITAMIPAVDYAFIDGTFYDGDEIPHRNISEIPHPFVIESIALFNHLPATQRDKIFFIHFNHTNPLLDPESHKARMIVKEGFNIARTHDVFRL